MTPATPEERDLAIRLLTDLAAAKDADAAHKARMALLDSGLPAWGDPIGTPCPADDPDAGYGLTLGCPTTKSNGHVVHNDGHSWLRLTARIEHCSRIARASWTKKTTGGAS